MSYTPPLVDLIAVNASVTAEPTCNGDTDGALSFNVTNLDTHNYTYTVTNGAAVIVASGGPIATTPTPITGLGADIYTVEVTDTTTNCTDTDTVTITEPAVIAVSATSAEANCGDITGTVTASATGGRGNYEYELRDSAGVVVVRAYQTSNIFTSLAAGDYTVFVQDGSVPTACETTVGVPVTVGTKPAPTIAAVPGGDACYDTTDQATQWITITPGVAAPLGPFEYSLNGGAGVAVTFLPGPAPANTFEIPNLTPGTYNVTVTNTDTNCTTNVETFTIAPQVRIVASLTKDLDCSASSDAVIDVTTADGNGARTIEVSSDGGATYTATTSPFTTGVAGNYQFRVTDSEGCTADSSVITITASVAPTLTAPDVIVLCDGDTGTVSITVDGSFGPYQIDFNGGGFVPMTGSTMQFPNLPEGTYSYTVTDNKSCPYTDTVDVIAPDPIIEASRIETPVTCGGSVVVTDLGAIDFTIADRGPLTYTYTLIDASDLFTVPLVPSTTAASTPNPTTLASNSVRFEGLDFGEYYIVVEDQNGCAETFGTFEIFSPPTDLIQNITISATCPGGVTFDIDVNGGSGIDGSNPPPGFDIRIVGEPSPGLGDFVPLNDDPANATVEDATTPIRIHQYTNLEFNRSYILEVRDNATNCLYQEQVDPVTPPSEPSIINDVVTNVSCNVTPAVNDGEVSFDISAYDPSVTQVSWEVFDVVTNVSLGAAYVGSAAGLTGADVPVTISNFAPGQYYVTVREDDGTLCPARYDFTIDIPAPLNATAGTVSAGNCNATAEVIISTTGGTQFTIPPTADGYTYALVPNGAGDPGVYPLNSNVIDLGSVDGQVQDIWVADLNGCAFGPISVTTVITPNPQVTVPAFVDDACNFDNNYTFTVNGSDGLPNASGNYFYGIDDANNAGDTPIFTEDGITHTFTVTSAGTYNITIRDVNGCTDVETITVYEEVLIAADFTTEPNCRDADGEITVTSVTGGSDYATNPGNFSFTLVDNGTNAIVAGPQASNIFPGIAAGDYRVEVVDAAIAAAPGCTAIVNVSRDIPLDPIVTTTPEDVSCVGGNDGSILADIQVGTDANGPYTYQLFDYTGAVRGAQIGADQINDPLFDNLIAGEYLVVVTSSRGCEGENPETIGEPPVLNATANSDPYSCSKTDPPFPDITVDITGGTAPYRISYNGPTGTFTNIVVTGTQHIVDADIAGTYNFDILDSKGCIFTVSETVNPFPIMTDATITPGAPIDCVTNVQDVTVTVTGGTGTYDYVEVSGAVAAQNGVASNSATFALPGVGTYQFRITDTGTDCSILTPAYEVAQYDLVTATIAPDQNLTCFESGDGSIVLTVTDLTAPGTAYGYTVTNLTTTTTTSGSGDTSTGPLTIGSLEAGTIQVTVTDLISSCTEVSNTITLTQPNDLIVSLVNQINANCNANGIVNVTATGGTGGYTYTADDGAGNIFTNNDGNFSLPDPTGSGGVGTPYTITVTDANSCPSNSLNITVDYEDTAVVDPIAPYDVCTIGAGYTFTVTAAGFGTLQYQIENSAGVASTPVNGSIDNENHEFTVTAADTYTVRVFDGNGCVSNDQTITIAPDVSVEAVFSGPIDCNDPVGTITATVTGGSDYATNPGNFNFRLLDSSNNPVGAPMTAAPGPGVNEYTFQNIAPGDYTVEVTDVGIDAAGCIVTDLVSRPVPNNPIADAPIVEDVSCNAGSGGVITVVLNAASIDTPYTYELFVYDPSPTATGALVTGPQASPTFTGLVAGDYEVIITSGLGCAMTVEPITVGEPAVLDATTSQSNYTCNASNNDNFPDITIDITGGNAPYRISYNGPTGTFTNIVVSGAQHIVDADIDGVYNFTIEDSKGCTFAVSETVNPFPIMSNPTATLVTRINCNPDPEVVTVSIDGGTSLGDFLFEVTSGPAAVASQTITATGPTTTATFDLPAVGNYNFIITDLTTTCTIPVSYTVTEFNTIEIIASQQTPETCFGDADGTINISITGYTGAYSYRVLDAAGNPVPGATGTGDTTTDPNPYVLPSTFSLGSYTVEITETVEPFCIEVSNSVQINGPLAPLVLAISPINDQEFCDPSSNGGFTASVNGAQGNVSYTISPVAGTNNGNGRFEGLPADTYTVTATDDNGTFSCTAVETFIVRPPANDVVVTLTSTDVSCFGSVDGQIVATATGSNGPFRYSIRAGGGTESAAQTSNTFENLRPNVVYTITAYDEIGCVATETATLAEPAEVTVNVTSGPLLNCGDTTGTFTVSGTTSAGGGIITYYVVDQAGIATSQANGNFTLPEGSYQFYVEDANGCESQRSNAVVVAPIEDITLVLDTRFSESVNCFGEASARINASVTGGFGDYTFELVGPVSGIQSQSLFTDLPAGNYEYIVRTARACEARATFTVDTPTQLVASVTETDVLCSGEDDGQIRIEVTPNSGTAPYSFAISTDAGRFLNDASDGLPNEHTFSDLGPGVYDIYIQDANGCSLIEQRTIIEPNPLQVAVLGAITPETCADENDGGVTIDITGGTAPYETNITNNDADFVAGQVVFDNLPGGALTIFVRDANGCRFELPVVIPEGVALTATLEQGLECPVYEIGEDNQTVLVSEESHFIQFNIPEVLEGVNIIYTLNGINGTPNPSSNQNTTGRFVVEPGQYEAVMESGLCTQIIDTVRVDEYVPLTVPVPQMTNNPEDPNEYSIQVEGGVGEYTYYVTFEGEERELTSDIFAIRKSGLYLIRVVDASGCEVSAIHELTYINIRIPNYFTPNGDGTDDYWYPGQITPFVDDPFYFENMEVKVFDRYGRLLGEFNGDEVGWNGIYQGKELPSGDYWYTIILNDVDDRQFTGHFTLYR